MRDNNPELHMLEDKVLELTDTISQLADENDHLKDVIASQQWDATPFEKDYILDLRGNPGGLLNEAIEMANEFLDEGKLIVYTEGKSRPKKSLLR